MKAKSQKISKKGWTIQEQSYLQELCKKRKTPDWKSISAQMNQIFPEKNRSSKQCRERFHNYIQFKRQQGRLLPWTPEDDETLFKMYIVTGSKWSEISKSIQGRSQNSIKNRFYGQLRKFLRVLNISLRKSSLKNKKKIKQATITKILSKQTFQKKQKIIDQQAQKEQFLNKLKYDIISLMFDNSQQKNQEQLIELIQRIHRFNSATRTQNIRENRLGKKIKRKQLPPLKKQHNSAQSPCQKIQVLQKQASHQKNQNLNNLLSLQDNLQQQDNFKDGMLMQLQIESVVMYNKCSEKDLQQEFNFMFDPNSRKGENFFKCSQFD